MSSLLGGNSKQSSSSVSQNQAYGTLNNALGSTVGQTGGITSLLGQLLTGQGGQDAYNQFKQATGFQNQLNTGSQAITDNAAARGLLQSGATGKALMNYGTDLANQNFSNFLSPLQNLASLGIQAGNTIAGAGQTVNSTGKGSSKQGLGL